MGTREAGEDNLRERRISKKRTIDAKQSRPRREQRSYLAGSVKKNVTQEGGTLISGLMNERGGTWSLGGKKDQGKVRIR